MLEREAWREIAGFEGTYVVSSLGRIMRLAGTPRTRRNRVLRPNIKPPDGYACVDLYRGHGRIRYYVHALVADAFIGPRPAGAQINHLDGDRTNNRRTNLEYVTPGDNQRHAYRGGRKPHVRHVGSSNPNARLTPPQVRRIRRRLAEGEIGSHLAVEYGVTRQAISHIRTGQRWGSVS